MLQQKSFNDPAILRFNEQFLKLAKDFHHVLDRKMNICWNINKKQIFSTSAASSHFVFDVKTRQGPGACYQVRRGHKYKINDPRPNVRMDHFFVHYDIATSHTIQSNDGWLVYNVNVGNANSIYVGRMMWKAQDLNIMFYIKDRNCIERHLGSIKTSRMMWKNVLYRNI